MESPTTPVLPNAPAPLRHRPFLYTLLGTLNVIGLLGISAIAAFTIIFLSSFNQGLPGIAAVFTFSSIPFALCALEAYGYLWMKKYMPLLTKISAILFVVFYALEMGLNSTQMTSGQIVGGVLSLLFVLAITYRVHKDKNLFIN